MRLYEEIFKDVDGVSLARCTIVPGGGGYFEGVKGVQDFSAERIVLCFRKETIAIEGKDLVIKQYGDGDLRVLGEIYALQVMHPSVKGD